MVNDGSKDEIVETIKDERIRLIHQENAVARNRSKSRIYSLLRFMVAWADTKLPRCRAYKKRKENGEESAINIQGLPSKEYVGLIPNYFESVVKGEFLHLPLVFLKKWYLVPSGWKIWRRPVCLGYEIWYGI